MKRVALVMPAFNEEAAVEETMEAILASTRRPDEVVIGDGGSTDRTVAKVLEYGSRGLNVKVVSNPAKFPGGGRNAAARATDCEILLFCDFGNPIDSRFVELMVARLQAEPSVDVVHGIHYPLVKSEFEHCVACINYPAMCAVQRMSREQREGPLPVAVISGGSSIGCTRAMWERAGGFPEWLRTAEDKLFAAKLQDLGARIDVVPRAWAHHHMRSTLGQILGQYYTYRRGDGRTQAVSRHSLKLVGVYAVLGGLLAGAALSPWLAALALAAFGGYAYRAGVRRIIEVDGGLAKMIYLPYAAAILLARDWSALAGSVAGLLDWAFNPIYRRSFRAYLAGDSGRVSRPMDAASAAKAF